MYSNLRVLTLSFFRCVFFDAPAIVTDDKQLLTIIVIWYEYGIWNKLHSVSKEFFFFKNTYKWKRWCFVVVFCRFSPIHRPTQACTSNRIHIKRPHLYLCVYATKQRENRESTRKWIKTKQQERTNTAYQPIVA